MAVFLLVLTGILLIALNIRAIIRDKGSFKANLNMKLEHAEENGIEVGILRAEIAESLLDLQTEMEEIKEENNLLKSRITLLEGKKPKIKENKKIDKIIDEPIILNAVHNDNKKDNIDMDIEITEIQKLLNMGFSVDEAAAKFGVDKGEVILIKDLYRK